MKARLALHEDLSPRDDVKSGSARSFGLVFAVVFASIAIWPLLNMSEQGGMLRVWAVAVAAFFVIAALVMPRMLAPLNWLWFKFGLLLHKIVNPLVMGLLFFLTVTPIGLLMRALGKTPLQLGFDKSAESYWIPRAPPGPSPESMKRQF